MSSHGASKSGKLSIRSLDLTAASRVYLMEPQWNPTLEEQALARAHRIGQTRPVTTVRFVMQESLEEVSHKIAKRATIHSRILSKSSSFKTERSSSWSLCFRIQNPHPKSRTTPPCSSCGLCSDNVIIPQSLDFLAPIST